MINDSICCPTETTSFLAVTPVKPIGIEKTRKTIEEQRKVQEELEAVLDMNITTEELDKFWSIEMERQQLEIQKSFLLEQQEFIEGRGEGR